MFYSALFSYFNIKIFFGDSNVFSSLNMFVVVKNYILMTFPNKYCVHIYVNGKMRHVETIPGMGVGYKGE
jgi:hypothetical protein